MSARTLTIPVPRFDISVGSGPVTCKCCGVPVFSGGMTGPQYFIKASPELNAYIDAVGEATYQKEAEKQGRAAIRAYLETRAAATETGDVKVLRLLSEAQDLFAAGDKLARSSEAAREAEASVNYEAGRLLIDEARKARPSGISGIAAKLAYVDQGNNPDLGWHGGHAMSEMLRAANDDMQELLRRAGAK